MPQDAAPVPSRLLREGILDSEAVNSLSPEAEVFYRRLMSVVDDYGLFDGRSSILRSRLYALQLERVREVSLERWIAECVTARLVRLYSHEGKPYLQLLKLGTPRATNPKYPLPPKGLEENRLPLKTVVNNGKQPKTPVPYSDSDSSAYSDSINTPKPPSGVVAKKREKTDAQSDLRFSRFWESYPRKDNAEGAALALQRINPTPELLESILAAVDQQKSHGCLEANFTAEGRSTIPHGATWLNKKRWTDIPPANGVPRSSGYKTQNDRVHDDIMGLLGHTGGNHEQLE